MKNVIWRSTHFAVRCVVTLIQTSSLRSGKDALQVARLVSR